MAENSAASLPCNAYKEICRNDTISVEKYQSDLIGILSLSNPALKLLTAYLTIRELVLLMKVSRDARDVVCSVLKSTESHKSAPTHLIRLRNNRNLDSHAQARKLIFHEIWISDCAEFLARRMPKIEFGPRKSGRVLEDFVRALYNCRSQQIAVDLIGKFDRLTHLSLEVMEKNEKTIIQGMQKIVDDFPNLLSVELVGLGTDCGCIDYIEIREMSELRQISAPPEYSHIFMYISEKVDLSRNTIVRDNFRPRSGANDRRSEVDYRFMSSLKIMLSTESRRRKALQQYADSERWTERLYYGSENEVNEVDRFVMEELNAMQYLDSNSIANRSINTVDQMLSLPVLRLLEPDGRWNSFFRGFLILNAFNRNPDGGTQLKRLEFIYPAPGDTVLDGAKISTIYYDYNTFQESAERGDFPPSHGTYYQPFYSGEELTESDVRALQELTQLDRVIIVQGLDGCLHCPVMKKMLETVSETLILSGHKLKEIEIGYDLFRRVDDETPEDYDQSQIDDHESDEEPDYYMEDGSNVEDGHSEAVTFILNLFPYLRVVKRRVFRATEYQ